MENEILLPLARQGLPEYCQRNSKKCQPNFIPAGIFFGRFSNFQGDPIYSALEVIEEIKNPMVAGAYGLG